MTALRQQKQRRLTARVKNTYISSRPGHWSHLRPRPQGAANIPPMVHTFQVPITHKAESLPAPEKRIKEEVQLHTITHRLAPSPEPLPVLKVESPYPPPLPSENPTMVDTKYSKAIMFIVAGLVLAGAAYFGLDIAVIFESLMRLIGAY